MFIFPYATCTIVTIYTICICIYITIIRKVPSYGRWSWLISIHAIMSTTSSCQPPIIK